MSEAKSDPHFEVELERRDFLHYNWALAFERPIMPFFLYTFVACALAGMLGVWPAGRLFAFAVLIPLLAYNVWIWVSSRSLWTRYPHLRQARGYTFKDDAYRVRSPDGAVSVPYLEVTRTLETRAAFYLLRSDGSGDILPKRLLGDVDAFRQLLKGKVGELKRSSFL